MGKRKKKLHLRKKHLRNLLSSDKQKQQLTEQMKDVLCSSAAAFSKEEIRLDPLADDGTAWRLSCQGMDLHIECDPYQIPLLVHNDQVNVIGTFFQAMRPVLDQARSLLEGTALVTDQTLKSALMPLILDWGIDHPTLPSYPQAEYDVIPAPDTLHTALYLQDGIRKVCWYKHTFQQTIQVWDLSPVPVQDPSVPHLLQCQQAWKQKMDQHPDLPLLFKPSASCSFTVSADPLPINKVLSALPECPSLRRALKEVEEFHHEYYQRFASLAQRPDSFRQILLNRTLNVPEDTLLAELVCRNGTLEARVQTSLLAVRASAGELVETCIAPQAQKGPLPLPFPYEDLDEVHSFLMESLSAEDQCLLKKAKGPGLMRGKTTLVFHRPDQTPFTLEVPLLCAPYPQEPEARRPWRQDVFEQLQQAICTFKEQEEQAGQQLLQELQTTVTTRAQMDMLKEMEQIGSCSLSALCKIMAGTPYRGTFWGNKKLYERYAGIFSEEELFQQAEQLEAAGLVEIESRSYHGAAYSAMRKTQRGIQSLHLMKRFGYQPEKGRNRPPAQPDSASSPPVLYTPAQLIQSRPLSVKERSQLAGLLDPSAAGQALDREDCWLLVKALANTRLRNLHGPAIEDRLRQIPDPLFSWARLLLMTLPDPILLSLNPDAS